MMRTSLLAAAALACFPLSPLRAAEPVALERAAPPAALAQQCLSGERILSRLDAMQAHRRIYEGDAVRRAEMVYAATPPSGARPHADHLIVADLPTGSVALLFVRQGTVCATMMIQDSKVAAMARQFILGIEV